MINLDPIHTYEKLIITNTASSKSIYFVLVMVVVLLLFLLPIVQIDISSQSRGIIRSYQDKVPLQTAVNGKVFYSKLKNNRQVHKGDTLLVLVQDNLVTEKKNTQILAHSNQELLTDLEKAIKGIHQDFTTSLIEQEWYNYISRRAELLEKTQYAQQEFTRHKQLFDKGVIASSEFEKYHYNLISSKQALTVYDKTQKTQWENRRRELQEKRDNFKGSITKINNESKNYYIIAPVTGVLENCIGIQKGSFINASQIAIISPIDQLIVECTVQPNDIGLIKNNQKVKFQLDAFNYNQWGLLDGEVIDIDKNITIQDNQTFFKVRCTLKSKLLQLKSGYKTEVSNGMTLTARYIITHRSLYDLLFDKVDNWLNPKLQN